MATTSQSLSAAHGAVPLPIKFEVLLESASGTGQRRASTTLSSLVLHGVGLALALLAPLVYTETLDRGQFGATWLVAPPPPPPPPPAVPKAAVRPRHLVQALTGKLIAPTVIPREIARIVETELETDVSGVTGGVPGGIPGGQLGGVIGGIALPPAPQVTPRAPVRVGGHIRPPRLLERVDPIYPPLARQARVQGEVYIDAIIDVTGHVVEVKPLSGHPLLIRAALQAVERWVYEPTYLNDQPVPVMLRVTVYFHLDSRAWGTTS